LDAFDYLIIVFLKIGKFFGGNDGTCGSGEVEFYTLSNRFVKKHHQTSLNGWQKVRLGPLQAEIEKFKNELGFELIARDLGVEKPCKKK
jgi:hypothetical protein